MSRVADTLTLAKKFGCFVLGLMSAEPAIINEI